MKKCALDKYVVSNADKHDNKRSGRMKYLASIGLNLYPIKRGHNNSIQKPLPFLQKSFSKPQVFETDALQFFTQKQGVF